MDSLVRLVLPLKIDVGVDEMKSRIHSNLAFHGDSQGNTNTLHLDGYGGASFQSSKDNLASLFIKALE
jgi:hypothetical protein